MNAQRIQELNALCSGFRTQLIDLLYAIQTGHPGGSLSCTELLTTLYFECMNLDPANPVKEGRDRLVLSKGHAAPILYILLAEKGYFPKEDLQTLRQAGSHLQGHPCMHKTPGVELSTGPLGLGLGAALGMALGERLKGSDATVYALLGDGEIQEGVIWETAMAAAKFKAGNLIALLDSNGVQLDGTLDEIMPMDNAGERFAAFGWNVIYCNGHKVEEIADAVAQAKKCTHQPNIIIAKTVKGKGISFMEGKNIWHGKPISAQEYEDAKQQLGGIA